MRRACSQGQLPNHQRGVALITVLLIFAIVAILVSQGIRTTRASVERTSWTLQQAQAHQYALAGESYGQLQLMEFIDAAQQPERDVTPTSRRDEDTNKPQPPRPNQPQSAYPIDGGEIRIQLIDLQGRININNLLSQGGAPQLVNRYLKNQQLESIQHSLHDWLDHNSLPMARGAEDYHYRSLRPGYQAANRTAASPTELRTVAGFSHEQNNTALNELTALPSATRVNINTASAAVLSAIAPNLDGEQIIGRRESASDFSSVQAFLESAATAGIELNSGLITTKSKWYAIAVESQFYGRTTRCWSRVYVDTEKRHLYPLDRQFLKAFTLDTIPQPSESPTTESEAKDHEQTVPVF